MNEFFDPFNRLIAQLFTPENIRAVERGGAHDPLWQEIEQSGFLDALVPAERGGAGMTLFEVQPLWQALGYHAAALPVGETMIARYLLAIAEGAAPAGPIALSSGSRAFPVPCADVAEHVLRQSGEQLWLEPAAFLPVSGGGDDGAGALAQGMAEEGLLLRLSALLRASLIAGAALRLTEMTAAYANERVQFGKPIGRQQALQQNMAVMAEDMVASRIAAQLACRHSMAPSLAFVATAKSITSRAASRVAATAHAVHGAIGISEEYDLQIYTRRLHEWRLADGSESYWNRLLGMERLEYSGRSVDFVRENLSP